MPSTQKSPDHTFVEIRQPYLFSFKPLAEVGDCDDLSPDRMPAVPLLDLAFCVSREVFGQRSSRQPFNSAWENEELF